MYKLKKLNELNNRARTEHFIAYGVEIIMALVSLGMLIYYAATGDPLGRVLPSIGGVACFLAPIVLEPILKKRFSLNAHLTYVGIMIFNVFVGCVLNYNGAEGPYDEISHFLFGYVSSLVFFYFLVLWKDYEKQKPWTIIATLFLFSMAIAPLWEIFEFLCDGFLGTSAIGGVSSAVIEEGKALGLSGIALNFYAIEHSTMLWDSITDMLLHLCGTTLFGIEYIVYRHIKTPIFLERVKRDALRNREINYDYIEEAEAPDTDGGEHDNAQVTEDVQPVRELN